MYTNFFGWVLYNCLDMKNTQGEIETIVSLAEKAEISVYNARNYALAGNLELAYIWSRKLSAVANAMVEVLDELPKIVKAGDDEDNAS